MSVEINTEVGKGRMVVDYTGEAEIGAQGEILNPEGVDLLITTSYFYLVTPAAAAATLDVGIGASGSENNQDLHGELPLDGDAGTAWMGLHPAVTMDAALTAGIWGDDEYLTFTTVGESALPCVGKLYIDYIRLP